jgi:hypothetical protein
MLGSMLRSMLGSMLRVRPFMGLGLYRGFLLFEINFNPVGQGSKAGPTYRPTFTNCDEF